MILWEKIKLHYQTLGLLSWVTVMPLFGTGLITYILYNYEGHLQQPTIGIWIFFFAGTILSMGFAITPTTLIATVSGYLFGVAALPPMVLSYTLASLIGFGIAKGINQDSLSNILTSNHRISRIIKSAHRNENTFIFLCRISPVLPFAIMNVTLSFMNVRLRRFLVSGTLGMIPRTTIFVIVGSQAQSLLSAIEKDGSTLIPEVSFFVLTIVSLIGFFLLFKKSISSI